MIEKNLKQLFAVCLCGLLLFGCAHRMNVRPRVLQGDEIPDLRTANLVAVKSDCQDAGDVKICSQGWTKFTGSLCEFTNVASEIMIDALQRANVKVVDEGSADKTLAFSLEKAYCKWTGTEFVVLKV